MPEKKKCEHEECNIGTLFRSKETQTTRRRKTPRWILCSFKERRRNYTKGKIYLKQQLLKVTFAVKRYGKELLVQIKEREYKITTKHSQKMRTAPSKK